MKIAHLSDIHYFRYNFSLSSLFSKDLLATFNYWINRSRHRIHFDLNLIPNLLKEKGVSHVIITGDFTTTSNLKEYELARKFIQRLKDLGLKTIIVPGNHDHYNKKAGISKRFYQELDAPFHLRHESIICDDLGEGFKYIALDTTIATPFWSSQGLFSQSIEEKLLALLKRLDSQQPIVMINHFPIATRKQSPPRHQMLRYQKLKEIVEQHPNIKLYICGHTHLSEMIEGRPLILNSGSLTLTKEGSFHIMDLHSNEIEVQSYFCPQGQWTEKEKKIIKL